MESVNDVHSGLNQAVVDDIVEVSSPDDVVTAVTRARGEDKPVCVSGGRHAMGGQQFCSGGVLIDTGRLTRVLQFDRTRGTIEVEAGIQWPELFRHLDETQRDTSAPWAVAQKQTGADRLSIGGAVAANVHGRGLAMRPFVGDLESLTVATADGSIVRCSRSENRELFELVVGGYGLYGVVCSATLRLVRRTMLERVVELTDVDGLAQRFDERVVSGFLYGDFQFAIDPRSEDYLRRGVFSCYRPVDSAASPPADQRALSRADWRRLILLAHTDKKRAFELYAAHYLATSGQHYRSDTHQLADYVDGYHHEVDTALGHRHPHTEMITELYVPRDRLPDFMRTAADELRDRDADVIYGTVRLIERDDETVLAWARDRYACVIFNVCVEHSPAGIACAAGTFRSLIDVAADRGGSYYLTYHRWADRAQLERCHPRLREALARKLAVDPGEVFQSDWYRHTKALLLGEARAEAA